jgi:hypothetical protein
VLFRAYRTPDSRFVSTNTIREHLPAGCAGLAENWQQASSRAAGCRFCIFLEKSLHHLWSQRDAPCRSRTAGNCCVAILRKSGFPSCEQAAPLLRTCMNTSGSRHRNRRRSGWRGCQHARPADLPDRPRNLLDRYCAGCSIVLPFSFFHEKAGRSQVGSFVFSLDKDLSLRPSLPLSPCFHPHSLRSDWFRSVHVGRSRFSRRCHLFGALWFCSWRVEPGPGH